MALFTVAEASAQLREIRPLLDRFIGIRADAAELGTSLARGGQPTSLGRLPEFKAAQAQLDELMTEIQQSGVEAKGFAPLLLDFPSELDGRAVLLCWLEGDEDIGWYHLAETGFAGRRRLP